MNSDTRRGSISPRRAIYFVLAATVATASFLAGPAAGQADLEPSAQSETFTILLAKREGPGSLADRGVPINCSVSIDYPHKSAHEPGRVNVVSHIKCTAVMTSLSLETTLWRAGVRVGSGTHSTKASFLLNGNANATCLTANYQGKAQARAVAPPGYTPAVATANVISPVRKVTC